jgi:hypothetical protein
MKDKQSAIGQRQYRPHASDAIFARRTAFSGGRAALA